MDRINRPKRRTIDELGVFPISKLESIADKYFDGHFTIMRFTTNWRVCFGTPNNRDDIGGMFEGTTLTEAAINAIVGMYEGRLGETSAWIRSNHEVKEGVNGDN